MKTHLISIAAIITLLQAAPRAVAQGSLTPPPGPPGATMKSLAEIEPRIAINGVNTPGDALSSFVISQPGSYYLTGNIIGENSKTGISVTCSDVVIDLCGFTMTGAAASNAALKAHGQTSVTVCRGIIRGWSTGLDLLSNGAGGAVVEDITVTACRNAGIRAGHASRISGCIVTANAETGIVTGSGCTISDSQVTKNGTTASHHGVQAGDRCIVTRCIALENGGNGINTGHDAHVTQCQASQNKVAGISTYTSGLVQGCTCSSNLANGIVTNGATLVKGCACSNNGVSGVHLSDGGTAEGNVCSNNTYAGIKVMGSNCRVDGNEASGNDYGVVINNGKTANLVVRNICTWNVTGNFYIPANNHVAPIVTNPGTTFSGITAWSNIAY